MRFVFLTQYYPPETGAPQNRLSDLAERLTAAGHTVTVLTAMPNYPTGKIFPGYRRKFYMRETRNGVAIHRTWIFARKTQRIIPRLLHYFSFVATSAVVGPFVLPRCDVLLTESPPLFLGASGWWLARLRRARLILNVADLWPHAAVEMGIVRPGLAVRSMERLERWLYRVSAGISAQTVGIADHIRSSVDRPVHLLTNGADTERFTPQRGSDMLREKFGLSGKFVVGYAGLHGPAQSLTVLTGAARKLKGRSDIVFALFGDGPVKADLEAEAKEHCLENVKFHPTQPANMMPDVLPLMHVAIVPLYDGALMRGARPSKMFEFMAAGVPVILSTPLGEASEIVANAKAGLHVPPEDPDALVAAIERLASDETLRLELGRNARLCIERDFDRARIATAFAEFAATAVA